ncbi:MAG: DUF1572 family protein [Gemmatimonadetes bacterium]|nr:DUF1572 family protein [Candidatus Palauibacter rhopaloidicola]
MNRTVLALIEAEYQRYKILGERAFGQLDAEHLVAGSEHAISIATIVWHVAGNLESRFTDFLTTDGEKPWRDRESEFEPREVSPDDVAAKWDRGWGVLFDTLSQLTDDDLTSEVTVRRVPHRVDEALLRSLAHAAYHVGQVVYLAKSFRGGDWDYLSIPPGQSEAYNENPTLEKSLTYVENVEKTQEER